MAKQLNVFIENKPGRLKAVTEVLANNKININAFTIQDRGDFGLIKLIVGDSEKAYLALADKGYACAIKDIMIISPKDKIGNLSRLSEVLLKNNINIIDSYGFVIESEKKGICYLELNTDDLKKAKRILDKEGFKVLE
ncbi:MAG: acetolactate synthase [Candidatus Omnitrophica bacterium]|nr:acetolactate synthase [Candidatus Omnitrophota bacterium]